MSKTQTTTRFERSPEEKEKYNQQIELVRNEVASEMNKGLNKERLQKAVKFLGIDFVNKLIHDENDRPHRRICQGRAASSKPNSVRRNSYIVLAANSRLEIERAIHILTGTQENFEPSDRTKEKARSYKSIEERIKEKEENVELGDNPMAKAFKEALEKAGKNDIKDIFKK